MKNENLNKRLNDAVYRVNTLKGHGDDMHGSRKLSSTSMLKKGFGFGNESYSIK